MESGQSKEGGTASHRLARAVSVLTFPPVVALPAFLILDVSAEESSSRLLVGLLAVAFGVAWPIVVSLGQVLRRRTAGIDAPRERTVLLGLGAVGYSLGVAGLIAAGSPLLITLLMFCYATNTLVLLVINLYWKASAHAMGIAGPTTALVFAFGPWGVLLSLLLPIVGWSRVRLSAHTLWQVVVGAELGYLLTGGQFLIGLRYF